MRRAGILTDGVVALMPVAHVPLLPHLFPPPMAYESVGHKQLWLDKTSSLDEKYQTTPSHSNQPASTDHIAKARNE